MRSDKNNSVGFSAYAAVGSLLARYTGVENFSYAWEKTDPVTGEEYSGGQRALYAALGTVELFVTATGVLQLGKAAIAPRGCFTAGTQVVVGVEYDDNDVFVRYVTTNIEDIKVGDLVYSYDTINGIYEYKEVTETFALKSDHINYLTIEDENGNIQTIETTDVHPFWVVTDQPDLERAARSVVDENGIILYHEDINAALNGFWVEAKDLRIGDVFLGSDGKLSTLTGVTRVEQTGGIAVFNFTVEGNSNYFVLEKDYEYGQTCVLVHNAVAYRVMSLDEYTGASRGLWQDSNLVRGDATESGAKWLWDNAISAGRWKEFCELYGETGQIITRVETISPLSTYTSFAHPPQGTAYLVPFTDLLNAISK